MNSQTSTNPDRPIDRYFDHYSGDHRNPVNQRVHVIAVPAILWSVVAMLWCIPVFGSWFSTGIWAALAMFAAWMFYNRMSRALGIGMLIIFFVCGCLCRLIEIQFGLGVLFGAAVTVFVAAWIAQFWGHHVEGHRPSFFTDLTYLLIGPGWVLAKLFRAMGWRY